MRSKANKKRKTSKKKIFICIFAALILLFLSIYFIFKKVYENSVYKEFKTVNADGNDDFNFDEKRINVLVLGMEHSRTDVIMVATYDTDTKRLDVMSIHRDTYVQERENKYKDATLYKLNSLYSIPSEKDGVERLANEVSSIIGMPIHDYIMVDYDGVEKIVDAAGGVDIYLPFEMSYDDPYSKPETHIHIPQGQNHLDGKNAVKYLRWRQNNYGVHGAEGDGGRVKRQQEFMKVLLDKVVNPGMLPKVIDVALKNVKTSIDFDTAIALGSNASTMNKDDAHFYSQIGEATYFYGLSYFLSDKQANKDLFKKIASNDTIADDDLKPTDSFYSYMKEKSASGRGRRYNSYDDDSNSYNENHVKTNDVDPDAQKPQENNHENSDIIFDKNTPTDDEINNSVTDPQNEPSPSGEQQQAPSIPAQQPGGDESIFNPQTPEPQAPPQPPAAPEQPPVAPPAPSQDNPIF